MYQGETSLRLIDRVYEASSTGDWPSCLEEVSVTLGGVGLQIARRPEGADRPVQVTAAGLCEEFARQYAAHWASHDPWVPHLTRLLPGGLVLGCETVPCGDLLRSEFYRSWMRPQGLRTEPIGVALLAVDRGRPWSDLRVFHVGGGRSPGSAWFRTLRDVTPHLARALELEAERERLEETRHLLNGVLDRLCIGVVRCDRRGRILWANGTARQILAQGDGIGEAQGFVRAEQRIDCVDLRRSLDAVSSDPGSGAVAWLIHRSSGRLPIALLFTRLGAAGSVDGGCEPEILLLLSDPERSGHVDPAILRSLYGLTRAEAEVASRLAAGQHVDGIAQELHVSVETVRSHLKVVFGKTDTGRQADLVRTVLSGPGAILL